MDIAPNISYVLMTQEGTYLVEYLIGEVVFTSSISRAMIFSDVNIALKFKTLLYDRFKIKVSVNTYMPFPKVVLFQESTACFKSFPNVLSKYQQRA